MYSLIGKQGLCAQTHVCENSAEITIGGKDQMSVLNEVEETRRNAIEASVLRQLLAHLDARKDVQNIDLMELAGFCRNCLAKWLVAAAAEQQLEMDYDAAREHVYGMPYEEWKERYQTPLKST